MKPEPLKNKVTTLLALTDFIIGMFDDQCKLLRKQGVDATLDTYNADKMRKLVIESFGNRKTFGDDEIRSAVEWLKKELYMPHAEQGIRDWMNKKIDEAFEDVMKKEELGEEIRKTRGKSRKFSIDYENVYKNKKEELGR